MKISPKKLAAALHRETPFDVSPFAIPYLVRHACLAAGRKVPGWLEAQVRYGEERCEEVRATVRAKAARVAEGRRPKRISYFDASAEKLPRAGSPGTSGSAP